MIRPRVPRSHVIEGNFSFLSFYGYLRCIHSSHVLFHLMFETRGLRLRLQTASRMTLVLASTLKHYYPSSACLSFLVY